MANQVNIYPPFKRSGTTILPRTTGDVLDVNGVTQSVGNNTTKLATTAFVIANAGGSSAWIDDATNVYTTNLRNILAKKLGTATGGATTYNSEDFTQEASAWQTGTGAEDVYKYNWRVIPTTGATSTCAYTLKRSKNGAAETSVLDISDVGSATFAGSVGCSGTVSGGAGSFTSSISMGATAPVFTNIIAGLNSFVSFKGRLTHSATAEQFKFSPSYAAGTAILNEDLFVYYRDLATTYTGGVDALDGFTYQRKGQKQTTDATQQAITLSNGATGKTAILTTVSGQVYQVTADVVGKQSTTNFAGCTIVATFKNVSGTVTQVGTTQIISPNQTAGDWGTAGVFAAFTVSGADIRVSVTGKAATTIDWRMALDYLTL